MTYPHKFDMHSSSYGMCPCGKDTHVRNLGLVWGSILEWGDNCPVAMRAHIADLERGQASIHEARAEGVEYGIRLAQQMIMEWITSTDAPVEYLTICRRIANGTWNTPAARERAAAELEKG